MYRSLLAPGTTGLGLFLEWWDPASDVELLAPGYMQLPLHGG